MPGEIPKAWIEVSRRIIDLERRVAALEGHDVDAVVPDESAEPPAHNDKSQHKSKRR